MKTKNILYIADASGGGGGVTDDGAAAAGLAALDDSGQGAPEGGEGTGEPTPAPAPKAELTAESLAKAMKDAGIGQPAQQPEGAKRQYTQEEFDKAFHVVRPTKEQVAKMLAGGDEAVTTVTELLHAAARQASVMSSYQIQEALEKLNGNIAPLQQFYQQQQEQQTRGRFVEQNKDLVGFEAVGEEVVKAMRQEGVTFKTEKEAFTAIRDRIIKTVKALPGWEDWKPGDSSKQTQNGKSNMPTLSRGGGSGGAAAGQGSQAKNGDGTSRGRPSIGAAVFD